MDYNYLTDIRQWKTLVQHDRLELASTLAKHQRHTYSIKLIKNESGLVTFVDNETGIEFNLIPGGTFHMGISTREEKELLDLVNEEVLDNVGVSLLTMKPLHEVKIHPFLVSRFPVLDAQASKYCDLEDIPGRPVFDEEASNVPIHLAKSEIDQLIANLDCRLLSESECEFITRGGTESLFYFGSSLPQEHDYIERFICNEIFDSEEDNIKSANPFGLVGLGIGTYCADTWHDSYVGAPNDGSAWTDQSEVFVIRGGATTMWPWQCNVECLLLASAMRTRSDQNYLNMSGLRLARSLDIPSQSR